MNYKTISDVDLYFSTDAHDVYNGRNNCIKIMKDIIPIFHDEFMMLENTDFSSYSDKQLFDVFLGTLDTIKSKYKDRRFHVILGSDGNYKLSVRIFDDYAGNMLYAIPISILPMIKRINKPLHEYLCNILSIYGRHDVDIINSIYEMDWEIDIMLESYNNLSDEGKKEVILYKRHANEYVKTLRTRCYDKHVMKDLLEKSNLPSDVLREIKRWERNTVKLDKFDWSMHEICNIARDAFAREYNIDIDDIYNDGFPVEMYHVFRIVWFYCDEYNENVCSFLGESAGNFGEIYPNTVQTCGTKEEFDNAINVYKEAFKDIPALLAKSILSGRSAFAMLYDYIYNKPKELCLKKN